MDVIADLTGRPVQASLPICNCALVWLRQFWSAVLFRRFWSDILEKIPKYSRIPVRCGEEISWNLRKLITAQLAVVCISQMCRHYCTKVSTLLHKVLPNGRPAQNYRIMKKRLCFCILTCPALYQTDSLNKRILNIKKCTFLLKFASSFLWLCSCIVNHNRSSHRMTFKTTKTLLTKAPEFLVALVRHICNAWK